jgi:hypothetical protein
MPEIDQYTFTNKELLELLIKKADVHEGTWMLVANFGITPGNMGPSPDQFAPGVAVVISKMGIARVKGDSPEAVSMDAAVVNPTAAKRRKERTD